MIRPAGHLLRTVLVWASVLPFVLMSLIGAEVMPVRGADGTLTMVICTGDGMIEIAVDPAMMEPVADEGDRNDTAPGQGLCDWAAAQAAYTLAEHRVLLSATPKLSRGRIVFAETTLLVSDATGLPPSTGPPLLL